MICSTVSAYNGELNKLKSIFRSNGYPFGFFDKIAFDKIAKKFHSQDGSSDDSDKHDNDLKAFVRIHYLGSDSKQFLKSLSDIIKCKFNADIIPLYQSFKVGRYFQLKSCTLPSLCANIFYEYKCSCDASLT